MLSTLYANDAPSTITRLINIGVEPYLIGAALNACLAQRLVRRICEHCKKQAVPDKQVAEHLIMLGLNPNEVYKGEGREQCRNTGFAGRLGLYEVLLIDDNLRDMIARNPSVSEFRRICIERGMFTLFQDGFARPDHCGRGAASDGKLYEDGLWTMDHGRWNAGLGVAQRAPGRPQPTGGRRFAPLPQPHVLTVISIRMTARWSYGPTDH